MGNSHSVVTIHSRIDSVLPRSLHELADEKDKLGVVERTKDVFPGGHNDRAQFVHSLRVLLSSNGALPLDDKRFRLVFSRAPDEFTTTEEEAAQIYVSVVAISEQGVLAAKVVSERPGQTRLEAFRSFRKTVEMHMHKMLDTVPGPGQAVAASASSSRAVPLANPEANISQTTIASTILPDEPPSYQEASK